ncbi:MAG: hybrid sensor histidine kinase/response regulator [bacterium]|nr:hybrid sensor histidine kinase/response regulator [bacterium]
MKKNGKTPKATILLVDDNDTNLTILTEKLNGLNYQTVQAHNGKQAIEIVSDLRPDLIMMDVIMPQMDGFTACRILKEQEATRDIPVIFMTGLSEVEKKLQGFKAGGIDYITKPFQLQEVVVRVNTHITICKQQQQLQIQNARLQEQNALIDEQRAQLQEVNLRKDKFLSIISHDLQQPFTGIFVQTERIKRSVQTKRYDEIEQNAEQLQISVENYQNLLSNLLNWARLQQGLLEYQPKTVDINLIIAKNIALFRPKAEEKQLKLTNACEERLMGFVDVNMLDSVIGNLFSNAIKFTEVNGSVTVSASDEAEHIRFAVSDTGYGISEDKLATLFQIDMKPHHSGISGENGAGLGLVLCKEFLEKHGGRIWVESDVSQGSIFHCSLPKPQTPSSPG